MRVDNPAIREKVAKTVADPHVRKLLSAATVTPKSATDLSAELEISVRTVYRYIEELCKLGLLTGESSALIDTGGKYMRYRAMVKTVMVKYEGNILEVDLMPNEGILGRFMRFWSYMK